MHRHPPAPILTAVFVTLTACGGEGAAPLARSTDAVAPLDTLVAADATASADTRAAGDTGVATDATSVPLADAFAPTDPANPCRGRAAPFQGPMFEELPLAPELAGATTGFGRVLVVDLNGDGNDDLVATPAHDGSHPEPPGDHDKLVLLSHGDGTLTNFTAESGLADAAVGLLLFGDVDNDGDPDAYGGSIAGQGLESRGLWQNDGAGHFSFQGELGIGLESLACGDFTCYPQQITGSFADFDADGFLDLYLGGWFWSDGATEARYSPPPRDHLFKGVGGVAFEDATDGLGPQFDPRTGDFPGLGRAAMGVAIGDYDNDGDPDIFVGNYGAGRPRGPFPDRILCEPPRYWDQDLLWRNDGALAFTNVAEAAGVNATPRGPNGLLDEPPLMIGEECPEDVRGAYPGPISGNSFTPQFGDFDNDGDLDLVVGAISHPDYLQTDPTLLFVNQGPPDFHFTEEAHARGLEYREDEKHVHWVDLDRDGFLDLVATGFRDPATNDLRIYRQDPTSHAFTRLSNAELGLDNHRQESVALLDIDSDGDLDLYVAEDDGPGHLFRNLAGNANHGVTLRLVATAPRDATGARVTAITSAGTLLREVQGPQGHYNVQPSRTIQLGLGGDRCAPGVSVRWPNGEQQTVGDLSAGADLVVEQGATPRPRGE